MIEHSKGFTFIEVLIAVVLTSFSLLSISILQFKTLQFNRSATYQSQATIIAHDMIERMRANSVAVDNRYYHLPTAASHSNCFTISGCSTSEMAENDMYEWAGGGHGAVSRLLPSGVATVCIDSTPGDGSFVSDVLVPACDNIGDIYAIKVLWRKVAKDDEEIDDSVTEELFRLPCSSGEELVEREVIEGNKDVSCFVTTVVL